jgi:hypothetical protein
MTTARDITATMRELHPAPVSMSVRADTAALSGGRFYLRLPRAAGIDYRDPRSARWLGGFLERHLGVPVEVLYNREITRHDCGRDVEYILTLSDRWCGR